MSFGTFSVSLAVKDIKASLDFYTKLGFEIAGGDVKNKWVILRNGKAMVGLFQGMFEDNVLTFNPPNVRAVQKHFASQGVEMKLHERDGTTTAHGVLKDPDGNVLLFDQIEETGA